MSKSMNRTMIFNKSKEELRRVLDTGDSVNSEYLKGLGRNKNDSEMKIAKKSNKWMIRDNPS